ncbi:F-box domain protein [Purpureocillium lavendulum]|uniref:Protection of telomeres protein 1 n=1 Tax=Purpureocillium lavendulum TaxID=1247861 RepID=A0AB34FI16_9HYPO|nr:F-box domain protein [Purpureocillium lavendulum]
MSPGIAEALPPSYTTVREVLDAKFNKGTLVNLIGIVSDFRAPIPTRGKDWKCQIRFYDRTTEDEPDVSIELNVFRPEAEMPEVGYGDVIVISQAKVPINCFTAFSLHRMADKMLQVQAFQSASFSLLTSSTTRIRIYEAGKIPKPPRDPTPALRPSHKPGAPPSAAEKAFVSFVYNSVNKERLPAQTEFEAMKTRSINVKDKYRALKDVQQEIFIDAVVEVVREPYWLDDKYTLWVSDYTENSAFFEHSFVRDGSRRGQVGDPHGLLPQNKEEQDWAGPFGRRSMQVTCFCPHANVVREHPVSKGSWISMRNLHIKFGHNNANLEGFLREDRQYPGRINISVLDLSDRENLSQQLKDTVRRRKDYEKAYKNERKELDETIERKRKQLNDAAVAGAKRRADKGLESGPASKRNRKERRAHLQKTSSEARPPAETQTKESGLGQPTSEAKDLEPNVPDLNPQIQCENHKQRATLVDNILAPQDREFSIDGEPVTLAIPFSNHNYRTNVRVVNFAPSDLRDFSHPRKADSPYDCLSDNSGDDSEGDSDTDMEAANKNTIDNFTAVKHWEWKFALELEDAAVPPGQPKRRVWVAVDNQAAQCLVNLDASNLKHDRQNLDALRQRMFILWGDLEEHKSRNNAGNAKAGHDKPPDDSDGESPSKPTGKVSNRPFPCCVQEYGIKVPERDPGKANAGEGKRWERMYKLFGTKISGS